MSFRAWGTAFRDAFRSMSRNPIMSIASMATVAVSLLVLSVVILLAVNLEHMASSVEQQVQIRAYMCSVYDEEEPCNKQTLTEEQTQALVAQVRQLPGVKQVTFVSKEEALQQMREEFGEQSDLLEGLEGENPLRDSIDVQVEQPEQIQTVASSIKALKGIADVNYGQEYVDKLLAFTRAVRIGGIGLVLMLVIATVLTIANTIRLAVYARRREISIMKLVGATNWYIERPFILEGIFLGVIGALAAMALTGWGYSSAVAYVTQNIPFLPMVSAGELISDMTLALMLLGGGLGALGSAISTRRYLKV